MLKTDEEVDCTNLLSCISHNPKFSKFEKAVILSKMILFSFSKRQVQFSNMSAPTVQSFRLIASKMKKELILQTLDPVLAITRKFSEFEKVVILSK